MSINWIKITDRAREGIKIINALPYDTFTTVLLYVHRQMTPGGTAGGVSATGGGSSGVPNATVGTSVVTTERVGSSNQTSLTSSEPEYTLEELERLVGVPRNDFLLLIKTFSYILRRISTFIIKPSQLQRELREKLQLHDEAKIDAILRLWVRQTTPLLNNLASDRYESNVIEDVAWKINVEVSSHCQQREKTPLAVLQLKTGAGEDINLEMTQPELMNLFNQFEQIQTELDATLASMRSPQPSGDSQ
ncbi:COMM domain-containing protein 10 [Scaptodrosophila lebanonensis]|uniref:COMM domain-containing protein 10 n=1 Tax=Drosophila lebanonensis TaxID=7225 RepID=A0A6J2TY19_DROLE|nr:COMM domain-containing protein 10 [Scaptodrosophila lebanonensis]